MEGIPLSPVEDLMQEHGVLHRILLIYENLGIRAAQPRKPVRIEAVALETAEITRRFVEGYHQTLEEEYVFPFFLQRNTEVKLIQALLRQHHAARCITEHVIRTLKETPDRNNRNRQPVTALLKQYVALYAPHAAREDTELFPLFRTLVSDKQWNIMGEKFEASEERNFGQDGFKAITSRVADIEQTLGIYDLNTFTPECKF